jgi:hypothetical protein
VTDLARVQLPRREGPVTWSEIALLFREILAKQDPRYPQNDFAAAFVANADGTATIGSGASVTSQVSLPMVAAGNLNSAQTTQPLSSTGSASTAAIQVAAHVVQYGFGTVSYNGGTISGLTPLTKYYVYADDPGYAGGAVAYAATTSFPTVVASRNRYLVGAITTANSAPTGNVIAASSTSPITFQTSGAHGFVSGNTVRHASLPGDFAVLNNVNHVITVTASDQYTVAVDGSTFTAYTSGGTVTRVSTPSTGGGGGGAGLYPLV